MNNVYFSFKLLNENKKNYLLNSLNQYIIYAKNSKTNLSR